MHLQIALQMDGRTCPTVILYMHYYLFVFVFIFIFPSSSSSSSVLHYCFVWNSRNQTYKLSFIIHSHNLNTLHMVLGVCVCVRAIANARSDLRFVQWVLNYYFIVIALPITKFDFIYHIFLDHWFIVLCTRPLTPCTWWCLCLFVCISAFRCIFGSSVLGAIGFCHHMKSSSCACVVLAQAYTVPHGNVLISNAEAKTARFRPLLIIIDWAVVLCTATQLFYSSHKCVRALPLHRILHTIPMKCVVHFAVLRKGNRFNYVFVYRYLYYYN